LKVLTSLALHKRAMTLLIRQLIFVCAFVLATTQALAQDWKNPEAKFDASTLLTSKTTISWFRVDNVQATCEKESRKRGLGGFGYAISACSFWQGDNCQIFTGKKTTMHELGHETRHCFQGNFH
jgi:hypothetical protein